MFRRRPLMCQMDLEDVHRDDHRTDMVPDGTGGMVSRTVFADGSTTYHFGGPVGNVCYDENGEEC